MKFDLQKKQDIQVLFENEWSKVEERTVYKINNKDEYKFSVQVCSDDVFVFGVTKDEQVLLLHEYFPSLHKKVPTLISGEVKEHPPAVTAKIELLEETGCSARKFINLGNASRGKYTTGRSYFFLALDVKKVSEQKLEDGEDIDIEFINKEKMISLLKSSKIESTFEVACAYHALDYLGWL